MKNFYNRSTQLVLLLKFVAKLGNHRLVFRREKKLQTLIFKN